VRQKDFLRMDIFFQEGLDVPNVKFNTDGEKWAWFAGLIDGEGTFCIVLPTKGRGAEVSLRIAMKHGPIIKFLLLLFGGAYSICRRGSSLYWYYAITGKRLVEILPNIIPYLIVKRREAELVLEAWENRYNLDRLREIKEELRELHPEKSKAGYKGFAARLAKYGLNRQEVCPSPVRSSSPDVSNFREITDEEFESIKDMVYVARPRRGRPPSDIRKVINGMLYILTTGCKIRDCPGDRYVSYFTVKRYVKIFKDRGVWDKLLGMFRDMGYSFVRKRV